MSDPFHILARFLDRFDHEVEGRSQEDLPEETRIRLRQLAAGNLAPEERDELIELLCNHPQWVKALAAEIKALRPPQATD